MSLINDALKRAKETQSPEPPAAGEHLHFRPVEGDHSVRHGLGLLLPIALALIALLGLFFVWELAHKNSGATPEPELVARAATSTAPAPAPPANPSSSRVLEPAPATGQPGAVPGAPEPRPATAPAEPATAPVADEPPAPPKPAPLRLQGIAFNPAHPSAVINNKTVYIGDRVGEFRVSAITAETATLFNASHTNVLTLGD